MARRRRDFVKRAIDAIPDLEFVFERLEVNVARAVLDRLVKDEIDEANDWRRIRLRFNRGFAIGLAQLQKLPSFTELLENVLHASRVGAVILFDQLFDLFGRRHHYLHFFTERETEVVCGLEIKWIDQRDP